MDGTLVGPRGIRLSGGQVQRSRQPVCMSASLNCWSLMNLSSALDVETEKTLWERLDWLLAGNDCGKILPGPAEKYEKDQQTYLHPPLFSFNLAPLVVSAPAARLRRADHILVPQEWACGRRGPTG